MDRPSYRDARTHVKTENNDQIKKQPETPLRKNKQNKLNQEFCYTDFFIKYENPLEYVIHLGRVHGRKLLLRIP